MYEKKVSCKSKISDLAVQYLLMIMFKHWQHVVEGKDRLKMSAVT